MFSWLFNLHPCIPHLICLLLLEGYRFVSRLGGASFQVGYAQAYVMKVKFRMWLDSSTSTQEAAQNIISEQVGTALRDPLPAWKTFRQPCTASTKAASTTILSETDDAYASWVKDKHPIAQRFADIQFQTFTLALEADFIALHEWEKCGKELHEYFRKDVEHEVCHLYDLVQILKDAISDLPQAIAPPAGGDGDVAPPVPVPSGGAAMSHDETQESQAVYEKVLAFKNARVRFHAPSAAQEKDPFKGGGFATQAYRAARASQMRSDAKPTAENRKTGGVEHALVICSFDLFGAGCDKDVFDVKDPKDLPAWSEKIGRSWRSALDHLTQIQGDRLVQAVFDGRSRRARRDMEAWFETAFSDPKRQAEGHITYNLTAVGDPRLPNRQVAFAAKNLETVFVGLPLPRVRYHSADRADFVAAGDTSNFSLSFTGVPFRHINDIPRMLRADRKDMTGVDLPTWEPGTTAATAFETKGEVLHMTDDKSIELWLAFLQAMPKPKAVYDITSGSGAAAIASALMGIPYDGLCHNVKHKEWLDGLMNKVIYAIVAKSAEGVDAAFLAGVKKYFYTLVEEGTRLIQTGERKSDTDGAGETEAEVIEEENVLQE